MRLELKAPETPMRNALLALLVFCASVAAQKQSSGGPLLPEQAAFDVLHYDLELAVDPGERRIDGSLEARVRVLSAMEELVLHLDQALEVRGCRRNDESLAFVHEEGLLRIALGGSVELGSELKVRVFYGGRPRIARRPPWSGGFTWSKTKSGAPWIATSCQQEGADLWWPCKDHPSDEPEGMTLRFEVPKPLVAASNGRLERVVDNTEAKSRTYHWRVSTPINNYGVALNVAPYERLQDSMTSVAGDEIPIEFYVLPESVEQGKKLLPEIKHQLAFFEKHFGPYPFRADKYGVAETPHLGMEHQTIIAYGYKFQRDRWDYDWLHHHELSHEWWGNLVTVPDWKDMWIHEGIGTYTQALYIEELHDIEAYRSEMMKNRRFLNNAKPLAPKVSVDTQGIYFGRSGGSDNDIYYKGGWVLHSLRWLVGKEPVMKALRRLCYPDPKSESKTDGSVCRFATTEDLKAELQKASEIELEWFFDVYVHQPKLPELVSKREGKKLQLRWKTPGDLPFPMPIEVMVDGERRRVEMPDGRATIELPADSKLEIDPDRWILKTR